MWIIIKPHRKSKATYSERHYFPIFRVKYRSIALLVLMIFSSTRSFNLVNSGEPMLRMKTDRSKFQTWKNCWRNFWCLTGWKKLPYMGIQAYWGDPTPESYRLLKPGEEETAEVHIAEAYDLSQPGLYTIKFRSPLFHALRDRKQK